MMATSACVVSARLNIDDLDSHMAGFFFFPVVLGWTPGAIAWADPTNDSSVAHRNNYV
jgi:hypothetical protein